MAVVTPTITSNGSVMDQSYQILSIDIVNEANRIPYAYLTLIDGIVASRAFPISDGGFFDLGNKIEIKLRWEGDNGSEKVVFSGVVVTQGIESDQHQSLLTIELKDETITLNSTLNSKVFAKASDDEAIKAILVDHQIEVGDVYSTGVNHSELVQYACTDWDFIVSRADVNGLLVCVKNGRVSLKKIELTGEPSRSFNYGFDQIYAIELEADGVSQLSEISCTAWDSKNQKMTDAVTATDAKLSPGDLQGTRVASSLGWKSRTLSNPAESSTDELKAWANATLAKSRLALIKGRISALGFADINHMDVVEIKGVGKHFNGKALVTGWRHRVNERGWITDLRLGMAAEWISARRDLAAKPASGLLPPINGLQIGVVELFEDDPAKEYRVKVRFPALGKDVPALWARLASPDAGKGRGYFFRPEPGDEVVLGFFNNDPRHPVIVGALFGSATPPPDAFKVDEKNETKGLVGKRGTKILFTDADSESAALHIETAGGNKIALKDAEKSITLTDNNGNSIELTENGITLISVKDLSLEAKGKILIKGNAVDLN